MLAMDDLQNQNANAEWPHFGVQILRLSLCPNKEAGTAAGPPLVLSRTKVWAGCRGHDPGMNTPIWAKSRVPTARAASRRVR